MELWKDWMNEAALEGTEVTAEQWEKWDNLLFLNYFFKGALIFNVGLPWWLSD